MSKQESVSVRRLAEICQASNAVVVTELDGALIEQSIEYLGSTGAIASIEADPYWPKWTGPWWQMLLLYEMGLASRIPTSTVEKMVQSIDSHYLKFFPLKESDIPEGADAVRHVACHCALGTMHQLLTACGIDVDARLPWVRQWYLQYQMADGGLNCDESAYSKAPPRSSIVSTVAAMEAILFCTKRDFTVNEVDFLDRAARYLLDRSLFRTARTGRVINESWLKLCFPRFYLFDILRGLALVTSWSKMLKRELPLSSIEETVEHLNRSFPGGIVSVERQVWAGTGTRFQDESGQWRRKAEAPIYPLLKAVGEIGAPSPQLTKIFNDTKGRITSLIEDGLLVAR
jgi:hypothetical protein